MKWPKGVAGIVLALIVAALLAGGVWLGVSALGRGGARVEGPGGLPSGTPGGAGSGGATATLPGTRTPLTTGTPGAGAAPSVKPVPELTEVDAFMGAFFERLRTGEVAEARAMATKRFADSAGPTFFDRETDPLYETQIALVTYDGQRWTVWCGEQWSTGPRTTRYGVVKAGGKLYIDSFSVGELP